MSRKHISLKTKLAAALLQMRKEVDGKLELIIPHEEAKTLTADKILERFDFHHYPITHAEGGPDEPWNLEPVERAKHREITAKVDVPGIAKRKRVTEVHEEFRRRMLMPRDERPPKRSKWASRPFPSRRKP
jgi:vacuolar-type H+-ATPase subunit I/STV1